MNLLAHFFLSEVAVPASLPNSNGVLIGNFIADFVRGRHLEQYSPSVIQGIYLHRKIDDFTDHHALPKKSAERLKSQFGRYAPVVVDVLYDHLLAVEWQRFSEQPLESFAARVYAVLQQERHQLPERIQTFLPHMVQHNWLVNYGTQYGIERSLESLSRRAQYGGGFERAVESLNTHYTEYHREFIAFFPELIHVSQQFFHRPLD
jgi:acyl carrier protein phosphodiesterase